jgi:hypothetical protein
MHGSLPIVGDSVACEHRSAVYSQRAAEFLRQYLNSLDCRFPRRGRILSCMDDPSNAASSVGSNQENGAKVENHPRDLSDGSGARTSRRCVQCGLQLEPVRVLGAAGRAAVRGAESHSLMAPPASNSRPASVCPSTGRLDSRNSRQPGTYFSPLGRLQTRLRDASRCCRRAARRPIATHGLSSATLHCMEGPHHLIRLCPPRDIRSTDGTVVVQVRRIRTRRHATNEDIALT